jgi:YD repeat-containing protein
MAKPLSVRCYQLLGILLVLVPLLRLAPTPTAFASLPAQSGLGELPWSPLLSYRLSERTNLDVNVANGNLIVHATDFATHGTGQELVIDRYYNSLLATAGSVGYGWTLNLGPDVQLQVGNNAVTYIGPSDAQYTFSKVGGTFTSPAGVDAMLVQNNDGSYTLTDQSTGVRYNFTSLGVLTAEVDKNGNRINLSYNGDGSLNTVTDTQGRTTSFVYNTGYVAGITDSTGRHITYTRSVVQNTYELENVSGGGTSGETYTMAYDPSNRLNQLQDQMGDVTTITYDSDGRVGSITLGAYSAASGTYTFAYNAGSTAVRDPDNNLRTYFYDNQGRLTKVVDAKTTTFQWTWTTDNHVSAYTDGKGEIFRYGYDANNNLTSITLPTGAVSSAVYGAVPNIPAFFVPTSTTDAQGNTSTYSYDSNGDLATVTNQLPSQNTTHLYYNGNGTVDHMIDARGNTTSYGYDGAGNLTRSRLHRPCNRPLLCPTALAGWGASPTAMATSARTPMTSKTTCYTSATAAARIFYTITTRVGTTRSCRTLRGRHTITTMHAID